MSEPQTVPRGTPTDEAPFCWQARDALKLIRREFSDANTATSALAAYLALTEISSEEGAAVFKASQAELAERSGLKERTIRDRLTELVAAGVIEMSTPKVRAPATFTLLSIGDKRRTFGDNCRTSGNGTEDYTPAPLPVPIVKELSTLPSGRFVKPTREELTLYSSKIGLPPAEADRFFNYYESIGWKVGRNAMKSWPHALNHWKLRWEENRGNRRHPKHPNDGINASAVSAQGAAIRRKVEKQSP
jgi:hypothetical protein